MKLGQDCFIVRDPNRQAALAYVYFDDEKGLDCLRKLEFGHRPFAAR